MRGSRERCPFCGKEIIETKEEAKLALRAFRTEYGARRGSVYRCWPFTWYHLTKGVRGR